MAGEGSGVGLPTSQDALLAALQEIAEEMYLSAPSDNLADHVWASYTQVYQTVREGRVLRSWPRRCGLFLYYLRTRYGVDSNELLDLICGVSGLEWSQKWDGEVRRAVDLCKSFGWSVSKRASSGSHYLTKKGHRKELRISHHPPNQWNLGQANVVHIDVSSHGWEDSLRSIVKEKHPVWH